MKISTVKNSMFFSFSLVILCYLAIASQIFATDNVFHLGEEAIYSLVNPYLEVYFQDQPLKTKDQVITKTFESFDSLHRKNPASYWIRITIESDLNKDWIIRDPLFPSYYQVQAYRQQGNSLLPLREYPLPLPQKTFLLEAGSEPVTIYMQYTVSLFIIDLQILDNQALLREVTTYYLMYGLFLGIIFIMIFYNFFLYLSFRNISYLYFIGFLFFSGLLEIIYSGVMAQFVSVFPFLMNLKVFFIVMSFFIIFLLLFGRSFLCINKYIPGVDKTLKYLIFILIPVSLLLAFFSDNKSVMSLILQAIFYIVIAICLLILYPSSFRILRLKYKPALYFIIPVTSIVIALFFIVAIALSIIPVGLATLIMKAKFLDFAIMLMIVLFALGLSYQINLMRREKEHAQEEAIEHREQSIENLNKANLLKDEFLANTSHELRTPLAGIIGLVDTLLDGLAGPLPGEVRKALELIDSSGRRLSHLINDLLDFSKIRQNKIELNQEPLGLRPIVDQVFQLLMPLLKDKSVVCKNNITEKIPLVYGDYNRIQQIFYNLIGNAVKFTSQGEITVSADTIGDFVYIHIEDTGVGIPNDKLTDIFNPFSQADGSASRPFEGAGLGLSITQSFVQLHGGKIWVNKTELHKGTTFTFYLPVADDQTAERAVNRKIISGLIDNLAFSVPGSDHTATAVEQPANGIKILVVDDDFVIRQVLASLLRAAGWQVLLAENGAEALAAVADKHPPDIVLLDLMMPGMTGYTVCEKIREQYDPGTLPIIVLTAKNRVSDYEKAQQAGANDYLVKPFINKELQLKIHRHLELKRLWQRKQQT